MQKELKYFVATLDNQLPGTSKMIGRFWNFPFIKRNICFVFVLFAITLKTPEITDLDEQMKTFLFAVSAIYLLLFIGFYFPLFA